MSEYACREIKNETLKELAELEGAESGSDWKTAIDVSESEVLANLLESIKKEYVIELEKFDNEDEFRPCGLLLREDAEDYEMIE